MEEKTDIRIIKTQRAIKNAFLELMDEVGFPKIRIKDILERAEINRSTFYAHYADKFDLLNQVEEDLLKGYKNFMRDAPIELINAQSMDTIMMMSFFDHFVSYIRDNGKMITLLNSDKGDPAFMHKLGEMIKVIGNEKKLSDRLIIPQNYAISAILGIMTSLIAEWVNSDFRETPEEFKEIYLKFVKAIPQNILQ